MSSGKRELEAEGLQDAELIVEFGDAALRDAPCQRMIPKGDQRFQTLEHGNGRKG